MKDENKDTQIYRMLIKEDKGVGEANGILSRLLRIIMWHRSVTPMRYNSLMQRWLGRQKDVVTDIVSERGNMNKEMYRANMSWNSFLKCLLFHRAKSIKFKVEVEWEDTPGQTEEYSLFVPNPEDFVTRRRRSKTAKHTETDTDEE